jgi:hypothetical protein
LQIFVVGAFLPGQRLFQTGGNGRDFPAQCLLLGFTATFFIDQHLGPPGQGDDLLPIGADQPGQVIFLLPPDHDVAFQPMSFLR